MKLIDNVPACHRLWSMRFAVLAALFGALELSLPLWQGVIPDKAFAIMSTACAAFAAVARIIKQESLHVPGGD